MKISIGDEIPEGWIKGRTINFDKKRKVKKEKEIKKATAKEKKAIDKKEIERRNKEKYTEWYYIYHEHGWKEFCKRTGYNKSKPNLVARFKKYVDCYIPQNGKKRGKK